ncbi:hypothetical protein PFISCL1PPCAC_1320, partial [Pristionchus fissidentatus]
LSSLEKTHLPSPSLFPSGSIMNETNNVYPRRYDYLPLKLALLIVMSSIAIGMGLFDPLASLEPRIFVTSSGISAIIMTILILRKIISEQKTDFISQNGPRSDQFNRSMAFQCRNCIL